MTTSSRLHCEDSIGGAVKSDMDLEYGNMSRCKSVVARVRRGLTLIELAIVLVILAALAGVAVQSLEPVADQARYDATTLTLANIGDAIITLPPVRRGDGSLAVQGFVSDMGRLPREISDLYTKPDGVFTDFSDGFGIQRVDGASEGIPCGWRGPYLQTATPQTGWGTDFVADLEVDPLDNSKMVLNAISANDPTTGDIVAFPTDFDPDNDATGLIDDAYVDVYVTVSNPNGNSDVEITLFIPDEQNSDLKRVEAVQPATNPRLFQNIPVGTRLLAHGGTPPTTFKYIDVRHGMPSESFEIPAP